MGTQSLKQLNNQIHVVELDDDEAVDELGRSGVLKTSVLSHPQGELWRLCSSPVDAQLLSACYNAPAADGGGCVMRAHVLRLPGEEESDGGEEVDVVADLGGEQGEGVRAAEFHPADSARIATVHEPGAALRVWDLYGDGGARPVVSVPLDARGGGAHVGRWWPHAGSGVFAVACGSAVRAYDVRAQPARGQAAAWQLDAAHAHAVRDLDFNPCRQQHVATCGDDGYVRVWDVRHAQRAVFARADHSHWVWCVRYNPFHDQLLLTAGSDAVALVTSAGSVSSERQDAATAAEGAGVPVRQPLPDGPLQRCEHEDSVYCAEWSPAEPWTFASLSYDGRLLISRLPRRYKYQILL